MCVPQRVNGGKTNGEDVVLEGGNAVRCLFRLLTARCLDAGAAPTSATASRHTIHTIRRQNMSPRWLIAFDVVIV